MQIGTIDHYERGIPLRVPNWLSVDHVKRYRYAQEPYFQETWNELTRFESAARNLKSSTYLLVKPDAFPVRVLGSLARALNELAFDVIGTATLRFCRYSIRELWRYEFNLANVQRYWLIDEFLSAGDSLMLLLHDRTGSSDASERLSALKGPTAIAARAPDSLRARIDARAGTLNHVHCPDAAIDLVREIGVLFSRPQRRTILTQIASGCRMEWLSQAEQLYAQYPNHSLRMQDVRAKHGIEFDRCLGEMEGELRSSTQDAIEVLRARFGLSLWEVATIANDYLPFNVPNVPRALDFERPL